MKVNLKESQLLTQLVENVSRVEGLRITDVNWEMMIEDLSTAIYKFLAIAKDKNKKVALVFTDASEAHNFLIAGIIEYHKNDDSDEVGGNWSFVYTFNKEDINDCDLVYANDPKFIQAFNDVTSESLKNKHGDMTGYTVDGMIVTKIFESIFKYLKIWLDTNARTDEVVDLVLEDHFEASVAVEDGIKVMSMVPHGRAKSQIKDDDAVSQDVDLSK